jgi:hypothetical protein
MLKIIALRFSSLKIKVKNYRFILANDFTAAHLKMGGFSPFSFKF